MSDATHSYYDWQLSTLMLAYDVGKPLARDDDTGIGARQRACEEELREMAMGIIPPAVQSDPSQDLPPDVVTALTKATVARAAQIIAGG